jgi:hypothetical protein
VIPKISRGDDAGGLIRYLGGPSKDDGRHVNFHEGQRVITGSLGVTGPLDAELQKQVIADLRSPSLAHPDVKAMVKVKGLDGVPDTQRDAPIWHCSLSLSADEGVKTDAQWKAISDEFMSKMGFDDPALAPVRWVAVRHGLSAAGNDHVHIAANLIREDGRKVHVFRDYVRAQTACNELEHGHGLGVVQSRESGVGRPSSLSAAELDRQRKTGAVPDRVAVESVVRSAADAAKTEGEFVRRLRGAGLSVRPRVADAAVTGYSVALSADGVGFAGGTLARDLTLPRLRAGWKGDPIDARMTWAGDSTPGREAGVLRIDGSAYRKATAELRGMEKRLVAGGMSVAEISEASHAVAGALSAAATCPEYARGEVPKAAREAGRMASSKSAGPKPLALSAGLIMMAARDPSGDVARAVMLRQLLATFAAVSDAHKAVATNKRGTRMAEPDGLDEGVDALQTVGVTLAARGLEAHSRKREAEVRESRGRTASEGPSRTDAQDATNPRRAVEELPSAGGVSVEDLDALARSQDAFTDWQMSAREESPVCAPERDAVRVDRPSSDPRRRPPSKWVSGGDPMTPAQRVALLNRGYGVDELDGMTKAAASMRMNERKPATVTPIVPDVKVQRDQGHGRKR